MNNGEYLKAMGAKIKSAREAKGFICAILGSLSKQVSQKITLIT